ncbi:MAG: SDR family oxidoreductase [Chitinophagales bacterium]|nr:SDR family oxidoreductase [Chitinophagales bacterium]
MSFPILKGKKGIIFGALNDKSIAWHVALAAKEAEADFVLTNAPVSIRMGKVKELAQACQAQLIPCDVTKLEDIQQLFEKSREILGGKIDFVLHAIGMSMNIRKSKSYPEVDYNFLQQTLDISAISLHKILQTAWEQDALSEGASIVALSYIAAQRTFPEYNDMADAKALLESIVRSFGYHYGKRNGVRINSVSQSPTHTTAGSGIEGFNQLFDYAEKISPIGNADIKSCADFCIMLFSDYTKKVTMQNLYHDGGFSSMGIVL